MKRELIVDRSLGMTRAAVLEDGVLCELHVEREHDAEQTGCLYVGRAQAIRPSVCAAFVDIGLKKNAFLPLQSGETLRCGEMLIVQGEANQPTPQKGLRVTRRVTLPGELLVLVPGGEGVRISKKIKDELLRARLTEICEPLCPPDCGLIVRTAGKRTDPGELEDEARRLWVRWNALEERAKGMARPGLLDAPPPMPLRLARDLLEGLERVTVNDAGLAGQLSERLQSKRASQNVQTIFFNETQKGLLLFDVFGIEKQIENALSRRVWLPCGGYLVFDRCEAMTVVDVNSGRVTRGRDVEETALRVDLEAAEEIARQLRLRGIGGIVAVDFIDLEDAQHREALLARMREAAARDRTGLTVVGLTRLGLMELSRRRTGEELSRVLCAQAPEEAARPSPEEIARRALRALRRLALSGQRGPFLVRCAGPVADALARMGRPVAAPVYALAAYGQRSARFDIEQLGSGDSPPEGALPLDGEEKP